MNDKNPESFVFYLSLRRVGSAALLLLWCVLCCLLPSALPLYNHHRHFSLCRNVAKRKASLGRRIYQGSQRRLVELLHFRSSSKYRDGFCSLQSGSSGMIDHIAINERDKYNTTYRTLEYNSPVSSFNRLADKFNRNIYLDLDEILSENDLARTKERHEELQKLYPSMNPVELRCFNLLSRIFSLKSNICFSNFCFLSIFYHILL